MSPEAFRPIAATETREPFRVKSEDLATIIVRFENGARGSATIGQVCAGHKNDLWIEVNAAEASIRWRQEQQNELWIGRRDTANEVLAKDPSLMAAAARPYAHLPGGHQEGWPDAFANVIRDIYSFIADGRAPGDRRAPAFATFEDGYRVACLVDAVLESHRNGGAWTKVQSVGNGWRRPMKLGLFTPVFGGLDVRQMLAKVQAIERSRRSRSAPAAGPATDHLDMDCLLQNPGALRGLPVDDRRRRPDDQRPLLPRQPAASRSRTSRALHDEVFRKTVCLAHRMEVPVVVTFSGCPGDSDEAKHPNWVTTPWPPEFIEVLDWQWERKAIPYWTEAAKFAAGAWRKGGALKPHPGFLVYNVETMLKLRAAVGETVGDQFRSEPPVLAGRRHPDARFARLAGAIFHVHAKDLALRPAERRRQRRDRRQELPPTCRRARGCSAASDGATTSSNGSALSARCAWRATTTSSASSTRMRWHRSTKGFRAAVDLLSRVILTEPPVDAWWT